MFRFLQSFQIRNAEILKGIASPNRFINLRPIGNAVRILNGKYIML